MRRDVTITIGAEGRDKGKVFLIRELPAMQAEQWAIRLMLALTKSGLDIPPDALNAGMAAVAAFGLRALGSMDWETIRPLLEEMLSCVKIIPDPARPAFVRDLVGQDDIEEVSTILYLRDQVLKLHTNFSIADRISESLGSNSTP